MSLIPSFFGGRRSGGSSNVFDPFSLDLFDPFKDFPISSSSDFFRDNTAFVGTRIDWKETPEAHVFKADLPGMRRDEVKVEIEDDRVLQISGERNVQKEDKTDTWHRVERSNGKFLRRFRLPENARMEEVKAQMQDGVLTVTVPKVKEEKRAVKAIQISENHEHAIIQREEQKSEWLSKNEAAMADCCWSRVRFKSHTI
ncbi:hypothetical protein MLD38_003965 [Melastoma candidum]|uniref:Uncharacterized protein n=1 Tax=Melastoma candidum TaxID=119954 RepID=A0ACB9S822_9MYRT|nr:hypothetical protein MLD38_003965 [Melastoma candidum]